MAKDFYYFKHSQDARHDPKIQSLIQDYGVEGYGRFWIIVEMLRTDSRYKLENKNFVWLSLSQELKMEVTEVKKFIKDCVEKYELFIQADGFFYSMNLLGQMDKLDDIRAKRSAAGSWPRD